MPVDWHKNAIKIRYVKSYGLLEANIMRKPRAAAFEVLLVGW